MIWFHIYCYGCQKLRVFRVIPKTTHFLLLHTIDIYEHWFVLFNVIDWPFVRGIHQSPVNSPHWALLFSLTCAWMNGWGWWLETPVSSLWRHCNDEWLYWHWDSGNITSASVKLRIRIWVNSTGIKLQKQPQKSKNTSAKAQFIT